MGFRAPGLTQMPLARTSAPGARYPAGNLYQPLAFTARTLFAAAAN
jgi:hypothetical protein